jgi:hypothetical protein
MCRNGKNRAENEGRRQKSNEQAGYFIQAREEDWKKTKSIQRRKRQVDEP